MTSRRFVAEALEPMLSQFLLVEGKPLVYVELLDSDSSIDKVILGFADVALLISANSEDDTIELRNEMGRRNASITLTIPLPWSDLIGKNFAFGWVAINQQGYCDGILLSFQDFIPQIALTVVASSIKTRIVIDRLPTGRNT